MHSVTLATVPGRSPRAEFTTAPIRGATPPTAPEWLRMPLPGQCEPFTGLKRSLLYELAREGSIRTVLIRKPGALRGVRLIEAASLFRFLQGLADEQNAGGRNSTFAQADEAPPPLPDRVATAPGVTVAAMAEANT